MLHNEWLGIYVHLHLILASFCLRSVSCGFEEHWMNFLISLVLFIKTTIAKLLRNVIFFPSSPSRFGTKRKRKKKSRWEKNFATGFSRSFSSLSTPHERNSSTRFLCENRETIVKVLGLSARLTSARLVIYCFERELSWSFHWAFLVNLPLIQNGI